MRPNRILRCLVVALLVASGLPTGGGGDAARAASDLVSSDQPRIVAISPLGTINRRQIFQLLINRITSEAFAFGYFGYIHGLGEEELYLEDDRDLASKALFTLYIEARVTRMHRHGPMAVFEVLSQSTIYYDDTPDGDFSDPETFRDGIPIATGEENVVYNFDPGTGIGIGDTRLRQTGAFPFEFKGELIQFGEVGNHAVSWRGKTLFNNPLGWTRVFATATTVQAAPAHDLESAAAR